MWELYRMHSGEALEKERAEMANGQEVEVRQALLAWLSQLCWWRAVAMATVPARRLVAVWSPSAACFPGWWLSSPAHSELSALPLTLPGRSLALSPGAECPGPGGTDGPILRCRQRQRQRHRPQVACGELRPLRPSLMIVAGQP